MKRLITLTLAFFFMLSLAPVARAVELYAPFTTPPSWISPDRYVPMVFTPANAEDWEQLQIARTAAENGADYTDAIYDKLRKQPNVPRDLAFELALLEEKYRANGSSVPNSPFYTSFWNYDDTEVDEYTRWCYAYVYAKASSNSNNIAQFERILPIIRTYPQFNQNEFFKDIGRNPADFQHVLEVPTIMLDGHRIDFTTLPEVINGTTMLPIRPVLEEMGAKLYWDAENDIVTITYADTTITISMHYGAVSAQKNGVDLPLPITPYEKNGRTYLPLRFISENFGQKVDWNAASNSIYITEGHVFQSDTLALGLPMSSLLANRNDHDVHQFGIYERTKEHVAQAARSLATAWSSPDRETFLDMIEWLIYDGQQIPFIAQTDWLMALTPAQREAVKLQAGKEYAHIIQQNIDIRKKWGDTGVIAWDMCRVSHTAQLGYTAGYITAAETEVYLQRAAAILKANFNSWEDVMQNYMDGLVVWNGENKKSQYSNGISGALTEYAIRQNYWTALKKKEGTSFYNDNLLK
ncbi:hypothetical protein FACS189425_06120 [Clostridia bacterium]|nr:hypothetical protein FACS189425_06120 [Clostridia bacterium]